MTLSILHMQCSIFFKISYEHFSFFFFMLEESVKYTFLKLFASCAFYVTH